MLQPIEIKEDIIKGNLVVGGLRVDISDSKVIDLFLKTLKYTFLVACIN